jgi:hypothetical protein
LDGYDELLCRLICSRTIADANAMLGGQFVSRIRDGIGRLSLDGASVDLCLDGDVITGVDSSHSVANWPECLERAWKERSVRSAE